MAAELRWRYGCDWTTSNYWLAYWGSRSLLALMARGRNPVVLSVHHDLTVLAFALAVSLLTALVFGAIPAWRSLGTVRDRKL